MKLWKVAFIAGSELTGGMRFEAWVTADDAEEVDRVCQSQVQPLQIACFESKVLYTKPQFIMIVKERDLTSQ